jgi:peptidoglycan hydrolase CwlO-like protein
MTDLKTQSGLQGALNKLQKSINVLSESHKILTPHVRSNIIVGIAVGVSVYVVSNVKGWTESAILHKQENQTSAQEIKTIIPKVQAIEEKMVSIEKSYGDLNTKVTDHDKFVKEATDRLGKIEGKLDIIIRRMK